MKVPVSLREEYRISSVKTDYPLCQDAPLCKDWEGTGAYFWMKSGDETRTVAETPSALLSVQEAKTGITARLQQETKRGTCRAEPYLYIVCREYRRINL